MKLKMYNTRTRMVEPLSLVQEGRVSIYLCGPTVQSPPHLGHARSGVVFDVLRRWLQVSGFQVTFCRNVTDIDDKIIAAAKEQGKPWWKVASDTRLAFEGALRQLSVTPPDVEPLATGHITEMFEMIETLLRAGDAYTTVPGSVYFRVANAPNYGQLSRRTLEDALPSPEDSGIDRKESPHDFALWKAAKPGEPSWYCPLTDSRGRPGWHIECSAMAYKYLGSEFDIHGGGVDLIFPHHENELAQSLQCGHKFARHWVHNGLISIGGEKMSKSIGNTVSIERAIELSSPMALRYYLLSAHYRSDLTFTEAALQSSVTAWRRLQSPLLVTPREPSFESAKLSTHWEPFSQALSEDLNTAKAIAVLHGAVSGISNASPSDMDAIAFMLHILGLTSELEDESSSSNSQELLGRVLAERDQARAQGDYELADALRRILISAGVSVQDESH